MTVESIDRVRALPRTPHRRLPEVWLARLTAVAGGSSVLAGLMHYAVVPEHRVEWWAYALFFTLLGAFEIVWGAALFTGRSRWLLLLGIGVNVAVLALWAVTRTAGLPFGPDARQPEAVGLLDGLCCIAEAMTVVAAAILLLAAPARVPDGDR